MEFLKELLTCLSIAGLIALCLAAVFIFGTALCKFLERHCNDDNDGEDHLG